FEALKDLDSNNDGKIDNQDTNFNNLKIWQDKNSDGKLDEGELLSLAQAGVKSLNTNYNNSNEVDANNNAHKQQGSFTTTAGTTNKMNDVWFDVDLAKTIETDLVEVNDVIANLPNLAGFGNVHSLHQAMALDTSGELQDLVEQVMSASGAEQDDALTQMIYHWTGVEDIDPNSRTAGRMYDNVIGDARKLKALEELTGKEWLGTWWGGDPDRSPQAQILLKAFDDLQLYIKDKLFYDNNNLLSKIRISTNDEGELTEVHVSTFINYLEFEYADNPQQTLNQLRQLKTALLRRGDVGKQTLAALEQAGDEDGNALAQMLARDVYLHLIGTYDNDILTGGSGFDVLEGGNGDDVLNAGQGNDKVTGGAGNDTYIFNLGDGQLEITDANGYDGLKFGEGITKDDITITQEVDGFFYIRINNTTDVVKFTQASTTSTLAIDIICFADNSYIYADTILASLKTLTEGDDTLTANKDGTNNIQALAGDDTITGGIDARNNIDGGADDDTLTGGSYADRLIGGQGNDTLNGGNGDDTLNAGQGNDKVTGGAGNDTYIFNLGDGQLEITDANGYDGLKFGEGITKDDVTITQEADGFVYIRINNTTDVVKFTQASTTSTLAIDYIYFADNSRIRANAILVSLKTLTEGDDTLTANRNGTNNIQALAGDDTITGGIDARNNIDGGADDDTLTGGSCADSLIGGQGNDTLNGGNGDDTLNAGQGNDKVTGGAGNDIYIFNLGDGQLEITDANGYDKLQFGEGITKEDVSLYQDKLHIYLEVLKTGDKVRFDRSDDSREIAIDRVDFSDGPQLSQQDLMGANVVDTVDYWQVLS
ncbi:Alkaline phosphatase (EC, partial [uncultured Gammaproteobacteria bacterium]